MFVVAQEGHNLCCADIVIADSNIDLVQQNHPDIGWLFRDKDGNGKLEGEERLAALKAWREYRARRRG